MKDSVNFQKKCPICLSDNFKEIQRLKRSNKKKFIDLSNLKYQGTLTNFFLNYRPKILKCYKCNHFWYESFPANNLLKKMYDRKFSLSVSNSYIPKYIKNEIKNLRNIIDKVAPSFLDYGSGYGKWSYCAHKNGFKVTSYEPSKKRINNLKFHSEFTKITSMKDADKKKFNIINLEQVLEHIPDPIIFMKSIKKYMNSNSILRISVPNLEIYDNKKLWDEWPYNYKNIHIMSPYEHLHGFNQDSLLKLVSVSGYKPISTKKMIKYSLLFTLRIFLSKYFRIFRSTKILVELV